jgi:hypothetical protein
MIKIIFRYAQNAGFCIKYFKIFTWGMSPNLPQQESKKQLQASLIFTAGTFVSSLDTSSFTQTPPKTWGWTQVLVKGKQYRLTIVDPLWPHIQGHEELFCKSLTQGKVKKNLLLEAKKKIDKERGTICSHRNDYAWLKSVPCNSTNMLSIMNSSLPMTFFCSLLALCCINK